MRSNLLTQSRIANDLVQTYRRYARDATMLRWTLLPVALRDVSLDAAHALIAALPTPPSHPHVLFIIASGLTEPSAIPAVHITLRTSAERAFAEDEREKRHIRVRVCSAPAHRS